MVGLTDFKSLVSTIPPPGRRHAARQRQSGGRFQPNLAPTAKRETVPPVLGPYQPAACPSFRLSLAPRKTWFFASHRIAW